MIRYAKKSDVPELVLLYEELDRSQAITAEFSTETSGGRESQIAAELTQNAIRYVVKEMNQEIIGFAKLVLPQAATADDAAKQRVIQITGMAVKTGHRHQLVGSELIEHIELIAQGFGADNLVLQVNAAARDFYRKQGFEPAVEVLQKELCARRWSERRGRESLAEDGRNRCGQNVADGE